jgi:predicted MFS family arabinose efflux permease
MFSIGPLAALINHPALPLGVGGTIGGLIGGYVANPQCLPDLSSYPIQEVCRVAVLPLIGPTEQSTAVAIFAVVGAGVGYLVKKVTSPPTAQSG